MFIMRQLMYLKWYMDKQCEIDQIVLGLMIVFALPFAFIEYLIELVTYPLWRPMIWAWKKGKK